MMTTSCTLRLCPTTAARATPARRNTVCVRATHLDSLAPLLQILPGGGEWEPLHSPCLSEFICGISCVCGAILVQVGFGQPCVHSAGGATSTAPQTATAAAQAAQQVAGLPPGTVDAPIWVVLGGAIAVTVVLSVAFIALQPGKERGFHCLATRSRAGHFN